MDMEIEWKPPVPGTYSRYNRTYACNDLPGYVNGVRRFTIKSVNQHWALMEDHIGQRQYELASPFPDESGDALVRHMKETAVAILKGTYTW